MFNIIEGLDCQRTLGRLRSHFPHRSHVYVTTNMFYKHTPLSWRVHHTQLSLSERAVQLPEYKLSHYLEP